MHQDATWYGGRRQPRGLCVRWGPSPLPKKWAEPPIFGPCVLRPNCCINQDAIWYVGRPQPRRLCVRWGPSYPKKNGHTHPHTIFGPCLLWPNGWMDEGSTWCWSRPRTGRIVLDMVPAVRERGTAAPLFSPMSIVATSPISATAELLFYSSDIFSVIATAMVNHWRLIIPKQCYQNNMKCH